MLKSQGTGTLSLLSWQVLGRCLDLFFSCKDSLDEGVLGEEVGDHVKSGFRIVAATWSLGLGQWCHESLAARCLNARLSTVLSTLPAFLLFYSLNVRGRTTGWLGCCEDSVHSVS